MPSTVKHVNARVTCTIHPIPPMVRFISPCGAAWRLRPRMRFSGGSNIDHFHPLLFQGLTQPIGSTVLRTDSSARHAQETWYSSDNYEPTKHRTLPVHILHGPNEIGRRSHCLIHRSDNVIGGRNLLGFFVVFMNRLDSGMRFKLFRPRI